MKKLPFSSEDRTTHFGFKSVPWDEKAKKVDAVFQSVATHYDLMNNVMSFGVHHWWKRVTVELCQTREGHHVLDLAGGSGDLTRLLSKKVGRKGQVILADINAAMLEVGRDRLLDEGLVNNVQFVQSDAQYLPFANNFFHCITMAFGLRNVTDKDKALRSMYRVCKPGGKLMILEFSKPVWPVLQAIYDWYSFYILPKIGEKVAHDAESYRYLVESIRMHPSQEELKEHIESAGFEDCYYHNLSGGIVALHIAHKY